MRFHCLHSVSEEEVQGEMGMAVSGDAGISMLIFFFDSVMETLLVVLPALLSTILLVSFRTCSPRSCFNKFQVFTIPTLTTAEKESTNKILQILKTAIVRCKRLSRQF